MDLCLPAFVSLLSGAARLPLGSTPSLPSVHIAMEFHPRLLRWPCAQICDSGLSKVVVIMLNLWTVGKTTETDPHFVVRPRQCEDVAFAVTLLAPS